jgi:hypothetical protein
VSHSTILLLHKSEAVRAVQKVFEIVPAKG